MIKNLVSSLNKIKMYFGRVSFPGGFKLWITTCSLFFICYSIGLNIDKLRDQSIDKFDFLWLFLGVFISWISMIINAYGWKSIFYWLGYEANQINLISLFLRTNLLKYLPGGIWHFFERVRFLKQYTNQSLSLAPVILEPLLMASAALAWVPFGDFNKGFSIIYWFPLFLFIGRFKNTVLIKLGSIKVSQMKRIDPALNTHNLGLSIVESNRYPFVPLLIEMIFILFRFGGFWCCLQAFSLQSELNLIEWLSGFSLAWTVGLVVPGAPGGLGVFETAMLLRFGRIEPEASLIATLLCYRLIASIADVLAATFSKRYNLFKIIN